MTFKESQKERRFKIVSICPQEILKLFFNFKSEYEILSLPLFKNLPENYEIVNVHWNMQIYSIEFLIYHESFPLIPQGTIVPHLEPEYFSIIIEEWKKVEPYKSFF